MRIGKAGFEARVKGTASYEFGEESLTSFAGLELVLRFLKAIGFIGWVREAERRSKRLGDFRFRSLILLVAGMIIVGARRLRHVEYLRGDPMVARFASLKRLPGERTLSRSLKKCTARTWALLDQLNHRVAAHGLKAARPARLTLDIDGTVVTTGMQVGWAFRGFNPHHRKNPSYYPILAHVAQTGHVVGHRNRPGNVHDSKGSADFLRRCVRTMREDFGHQGVIELRTDSAFFRSDFLQACDATGVEYAIKIPMWPWLNIRALIAQRLEAHGDDAWQWVDKAKGVQAFTTHLEIPQWKRRERIVIYRKRVNHKPVKGVVQLDLFTPDDGYWEHSVVGTNKTLQPRWLWHFMNGRGTQEKTIAEMKSGYAFASLPTNNYQANTAWQKLSILAHNIMTSFQLSTTAVQKTRTRSRTATHLLRAVKTLRFEWLGRAGLLLHPQGTPTIRMQDVPGVRNAVEAVEANLPRAA